VERVRLAATEHPRGYSRGWVDVRIRTVHEKKKKAPCPELMLRADSHRCNMHLQLQKTSIYFRIHERRFYAPINFSTVWRVAVGDRDTVVVGR
jgi:hypothetical protein